MAPGEAWLTPHHHSLGASPICSPGAASRRVLHTSSHSKGCHLEDRKRCALSPLGCRRQHLLPWGYTAKGLGERQECVKQCWAPGVIFLRHKPTARHSWTSATDRAPVRRLLSAEDPPQSPSFPCYSSSPSLSTHSTSTVPMTWIFFLIGSLYLCYAIPILSINVN